MWSVVTHGDNGQARLTMLGRHRDELVRENGAGRSPDAEGMSTFLRRCPRRRRSVDDHIPRCFGSSAAGRDGIMDLGLEGRFALGDRCVAGYGRRHRRDARAPRAPPSWCTASSRARPTRRSARSPKRAVRAAPSPATSAPRTEPRARDDGARRRSTGSTSWSTTTASPTGSDLGRRPTPRAGTPATTRTWCRRSGSRRRSSTDMRGGGLGPSRVRRRRSAPPDPATGIPEYYAAKGALPSITVSLAKHLAGTGITVNCVSPGIIATPEVDRARHRAGARERGCRTDWPSVERYPDSPVWRTRRVGCRPPRTSAGSSRWWSASRAGTSTAPTSASTAAPPTRSPDPRRGVRISTAAFVGQITASSRSTDVTSPPSDDAATRRR